MNMEIGTEADQTLFWEYLFQIFGIITLQAAHYRWVCTFSTYHQLEISSALSWIAPVRATGTVRKKQAVWPVHHAQITPAGSLSSSQPGGPP
jgi:hypothetical protein